MAKPNDSAFDPAADLPAKRWQRRPEERRREILDAAFDAFGQLGFTRATLADVAKVAGVSAGTISFHFKSKAELFEAVMRDQVVTFLEHDEALLIGHRGSYRSLLHQLMQRHWDALSNPRLIALVIVMFQEAAVFPESAQELFKQIGDRFNRLIAATLEAGIRDGEFRPLDAEIVSRIISSMIMGASLSVNKTAHLDKVPMSCEQCYSGMIDFVDHAVGAVPVPSKS